jgi:hypothetical protein
MDILGLPLDLGSRILESNNIGINNIIITKAPEKDKEIYLGRIVKILYVKENLVDITTV